LPDTYQTDYEIGQDNVKRWGMDIHNPVFWISAVLVCVFVFGAIFFPAIAQSTFSASKDWTIKNFDWAFLYAGNIFVIFCLILIFSPFGKIRLGGEVASPEFSRSSWLAMLFAAGMGIGLMFWSVAEPVAYYTNWAGVPLGAEAGTPKAAKLAMGATLFHWGLHPWAIYAVMGLALAFFKFNKKLPLTIRSGFYPIVKERSWGFIGHVIDVVAVMATIFGLATSLGFGAQQAAGGISYLSSLENSLTLQISIIVGVTLVAIASVVRGLDKGVKLLSNFNIGLAIILLLSVMILGPTGKIFSSMLTTSKSYVMNFFELSGWAGREDEKFMHGWTVFYWAWWISWSPFVGMFIARISKGRTVREFLVSVLVIPTLVTVIWMAAFGGDSS
jgi:BCCT family betaine/carnitine transporter